MSEFRPLSRRRFLSTSARAVGVGALVLTGYGQSLLPQRLQANWTQLDAFGAVPSPRLHAGMVYDSSQDRLLLFGGSAPGGFRNDVWAYSFDQQQWSELIAEAPGPAPQRLPSLGYDQASHRLLVQHQDAWQFDLNTRQWSNQSFDWTDTQTAWVSNNNATFALAGLSTATFDSMFAFDRSDQQWLALNQTSRVMPRRSGSLVYAPEHDVTLLFGGSNAQNDVLAYAHPHWTSLTSDANAPVMRERHAAVWVPGRGMAVFGGLTDIVQNDLWLLEVS